MKDAVLIRSNGLGGIDDALCEVVASSFSCCAHHCRLSNGHQAICVGWKNADDSLVEGGQGNLKRSLVPFDKHQWVKAFFQQPTCFPHQLAGDN
jgi:hypothetical protein